MTLPDLNLTQDQVTLSGAALQCRVTTEDPANGFRPDTGVISNYRSPGGPGVRLDGGTTHTGAEVSAHFDSMLVKLTCYGHSFEQAVRRARRAIAEFRIRGVATNLPFLAAVLDDPDFQAGRITTSFIDERPELLRARKPADRGTRILTYLAETTVNRPHGASSGRSSSPSTSCQRSTDGMPPADGSRQLLRALGPEGFARRLREQIPVAVTDTTFRDAHQSLLATRVRSRDLLAVAPHVARAAPQLLSLECWGGATYDVALRFLAEDPWDRLAALSRGRAQHLPADAAARAQHRRLHAVPDRGHRRVRARGRRHRAWTSSGSSTRSTTSRRCGPRSTPCAPPARRSPRWRSATPATCPTPARTSTRSTTTCASPRRSWTAGAHVLAIKDMAGLLRPPAARTLVTALRERFDLPVHLHTHDTAGGQLATLITAIEAGVDAVDGAVASMAGTTSQPSLSALVAATDHTERATGLSLAGGRRPRAVLGGRPEGLPAVRVRARVAHRPRLPPRDPRRPAVQPAPAGHRARAGGPVRADRGPRTPPPTGCSDGWSR